MSYYVWVGPRDIDCAYDPLFSETICYYSNNNIQDCREAKIYGNKFNKFVKEKMINVLSKHPDAKFIFYNPRIAYSLDILLRQHVLCLNNRSLLEMLNDKIYTRFWLSQHVPVLPSMIVDAPNLSFRELEQSLCYADQYVVQQAKSSGGLGTFVLSRENGMLSTLKEEYRELFIVSPYVHHGFAVNINAIIGARNTIILPPSLQISERNKDRILYHGADYVASHDIQQEALNKIKQYSNKILDHIKQLGYLGIIGLDFLVTEEEIYFLEINPRYQASSFLINIALKEKGLPSLSEINLTAFYGGEALSTELEHLKINYSFYKYLYTNDAKHLYYVWQKAAPDKYIKQVASDGWYPNIKIEEDAYCYSIIFQTNIVSLDPDYRCNIYSNIHGEENFLQNNLDTEIGLKIALVNQGCVLAPDAEEHLSSIGVIKKAVFSAIDFRLSNGMPVNAPVNLKFGELSPFNIHFNDKLALYYYDKKISEITIEMQPQWSNKQTRNGIPFTRIAYLSTDRLRLKHESVCVFKKSGNGCFFCNVPEQSMNFTKADFDEVLDTLLPNPTFRHILIGGGSGDPILEAKQIISVAKMIRTRNKNIPIYLMSLPPKNTETLKEYKEAGITEVAFNIEIWDRNLAQKIMPGKGKIPLQHYLDILKESTSLWGKNGNVRTAFIVGLNQSQLLLEATECLCKLGIQPMFSIFRPMSGTKLEAMVPPSNQTLLSVYQDVIKICKKYHMEPGPTCKDCRNNMLAL